MFHSSIFTGIPPIPQTESTMYRASVPFASSPTLSRGLAIPVDVSTCSTVKAL